MTLYDRAQATRWGYRDVSPRAVYEAADAFVIDVREPHEYCAGHIPNARLVPLAIVGRELGTWDRRADLVVVCRSGNRSARVAEALVSAGFHRVMNLAGGMLAYEAEGLPVAHDAITASR